MRRRLERAALKPAIGLGQLLRSADMTFNRALREELAGCGVSYSHFQHLWKLWQADGMTQAELSRSIGISTAASTSVLDALERRKLIKRIRQTSDRRKVRVFLTGAGKALERPLTECAAKVNSEARAGLSQRQLSSLFDVVGIITGNLRRRSARASK